MKRGLLWGCALWLLALPAHADVKISDLPDGGTLSNGDVVPVVRGGTTKRAQYSSTSTVTLGASTSAPNPYASQSSTTGLYSTGAGQIGLAVGGVGVLSASGSETTLWGKATNGTTGRTLGDHFGASLHVKDFGAKCDGTTDDTAAFNAGLQAVGGTLSGGVLHFSGECRVCGLVLPSNTILDGGTIGGSELHATATCATHTVASQNYSSLSGTGKYFGNDPEVPSWFGLRNLRIDGEWGSTPGLCGVAFYGPAQILENVHVRNCSGWGICTEDSNQNVGYWSGSWGYQEEGWFSNVYSMGNGQGGWRFKGPHDSTIIRYVGAYNQTWGFYSDSGANYSGVLDYIGEMHSYANVDYNGMYFGETVAAAGHLMSDGDRIQIAGSDSIFANVTQWYCGFGGLDCLTVGGTGNVVGHLFTTLANTSTAVRAVNWGASRSRLGDAYIKGTGSTLANTGLYLTGGSNMISANVFGMTGTGGVGLNINGGWRNRVSGIVENSRTGFSYTPGSSNVVELTITTATGQTATSGTASGTDTFTLKTATGSW